jgi:hypothetical protein
MLSAFLLTWGFIFISPTCALTLSLLLTCQCSAHHSWDIYSSGLSLLLLLLLSLLSVCQSGTSPPIQTLLERKVVRENALGLHS